MTPPDSLTEAIARAIRATSMFDSASKYEEIGEIEADRLARAALSCIEQAGYVVVEVAPIQAAFRECAQAYRAMGYANLAQRIEDAALLASRPRVEG